ncbi:MAG: DUF5615 family PIN-like protein, partial [candidate division NC10 bacterium]|nr:DUF5615 family PIN-like protein [candidate division NC10 bacterium]
LIDMPLSPELAVWLVRQGHDAVHALEVGLDRASDAAILERARNEQRVLVTADLDYLNQTLNGTEPLRLTNSQ